MAFHLALVTSDSFLSATLEVLTVFTEVDRMRLPVVFHNNGGCDVMELGSLFVALFDARVLDLHYSFWVALLPLLLLLCICPTYIHV